MRVVRLLIPTLLLTVAPASVTAQASFDATGFVGGALFATDLAEELNGLTRAHENSLTAGVRAGVRLPRFSIEGEVAYVPTEVVVKSDDGLKASETQNMTILAAIALLNIPINLQWEAFLAAGAGIKNYTATDPTTKIGSFTAGFESGSDFTFSVGGGFRLWLHEKWNIRFDARDYISTFDAFELSNQAGDLTKTQHDVLLTLGVGWTPGGQP